MDKVTIPELMKRKAAGRTLTMLTAYDALFAEVVDEAGIDIALVGDSLGVVVQGHETTLPVTVEQMLYHTRLVSRAVKRALVVADMPFLSYQVSREEAIRNAGRFLQEAGAAAVKLEGGRHVADTIEALTRAEIPVMAHLGMTPQAYHRLGGYRVQGRDEISADRLLADAKTVEAAGAFALVLESIPTGLAQQITGLVAIPTIGIGAGPFCDGQVLVLHDLLGLFEKFTPKFVRRYAHLRREALKAVQRFKEDVEHHKFPTREEGYE